MRTRKTTKTKTTLSTKRVFGVFCFQEQQTVLENTKQTGPKFLEFEHLDVVVKNNSLTSDLYQVRKNLGSQNEVFP